MWCHANSFHKSTPEILGRRGSTAPPINDGGGFLDVSSGSGQTTVIPGSACVPRAVFGVPPNTIQATCWASVAHAEANPQEVVRPRSGARDAPHGDRDGRAPQPFWICAVIHWKRRGTWWSRAAALPTLKELCHPELEHVGVASLFKQVDKVLPALPVLIAAQLAMHIYLLLCQSHVRRGKPRQNPRILAPNGHNIF